jgi:hypothetical protein
MSSLQKLAYLSAIQLALCQILELSATENSHPALCVGLLEKASRDAHSGINPQRAIGKSNMYSALYSIVELCHLTSRSLFIKGVNSIQLQTLS